MCNLHLKIKSHRIIIHSSYLSTPELVVEFFFISLESNYNPDDEYNLLNFTNK